MKCIDVRTFFSQVAQKSASTQAQSVDIDFLSTNGYISVMPKEEYDRALAEVATLSQVTQELQKEMMEARDASAVLREDWKKTHSILFHFEGQEKKQAELAALESQRNIVSKEEADVVAKDSKIKELIQKKSTIDRMTQYNGIYVALTGLGVMTLHDLNIRNYRVSDNEFSDFIEERVETFGELRSIAERGNFDVANLRVLYPEVDLSQLWSVGIGLGKLQGDPNQVIQRFLLALRILRGLDSTFDNKLMAAEIMTASRPDPTQPTTTSDLENLEKSLESLDHEVRHHAHIPKEQSAGIAAMVMFGRRYDGTYPTDRFMEFCKLTLSNESAAILSVMTTPVDQLTAKFQSFRSLFSSWGYELSEDTELASAFLSISELGPEDVRTKLTIILDALRVYLEYPIVAASILTSIPTLEANETLDLMEKAYTLLGAYAAGLERSEIISLAVRMIHGIKNELVKELDPTAKIMKTPVQFTYVPSPIFFMYRAPLIIAHSRYYSSFGGFGAAHPGHVHGGFAG